MSRIYEAMRRAHQESQPPSALERDDGIPEIPRTNGLPESVRVAFERLAQEITSSLTTDELRTIIVVSAVQGEGASTVARGLATILGQTEPTLLVDANLRTPTQHLAFGRERGPGLSDVAGEKVALKEAIREHVAPGLDLLCSGTAGGGPALSTEALPQIKRYIGTQRFRDDALSLPGRYKWAIADMPPVTVYADALNWASNADGAIIVLRAEHTRWEVATKAKQILDSYGIRILGAVLNRRKYHIPDSVYKLL
ncbi:MAG TPA: CpsD/CapB family tyrosine-protein kinase [Vicinamibacteria bacterium]|nr:CpsD/CapB family tyrosine-protein kinase [Vicinamibacteria bacterium]